MPAVRGVRLSDRCASPQSQFDVVAYCFVHALQECVKRNTLDELPQVPSVGWPVARPLRRPMCRLHAVHLGGPAPQSPPPRRRLAARIAGWPRAPGTEAAGLDVHPREVLVIPHSRLFVSTVVWWPVPRLATGPQFLLKATFRHRLFCTLF